MSRERILLARGAASFARADSGGTVSPDLLDAIRQRLISFALIVGLGLLLFVVVSVSSSQSWAELEALHVARLSSALVLLGVVVLVVVGARLAKRARRLEQIGVGFVLLLAVLGGLGRYGVLERWGVGSGWTGLCVIVVLLPALIPLSPRRALLTAIGVLALDAGGLALGEWLHGEAVGTHDYRMVYRGYVVSAGVAYAVAYIVQDLRARLSSARKLGSYELLERVGAGGMGEVWRARHGSLARPAAIKLLNVETLARQRESGRARMIARFEREAQATARLECPHTVDVYDYGVADDGTLYYAMELLDGVDLHEAVVRSGRMAPARVAHLLVQACESLAEAHAHGLIHRDIKPSNLFLCRYGGRHDFVKVLDFGLVKLLEGAQTHDPEAPQLTGDAVAGTAAFMPPEQALRELDNDARSDVYALACVGYWLLSAKLVFEASSAAELIMAHVREEPVPPGRRIGVALPDALEGLLMQALAKDPAYRPQSAAAFAEALRKTGLPDQWTQAQARAAWEGLEGSTRGAGAVGEVEGVDEIGATAAAAQTLPEA